MCLSKLDKRGLSPRLRLKPHEYQSIVIRFMNKFYVAISRVMAILLLTWQTASLAEVISPPPQSDVRVIIDISGSMKKNDPKNLRQPALRLLTNLLPADSEAGVWTFGQWVNMLVKHGDVDQSWRDLANKKADEIHSLALYTNIGLALEKAAYDWSGPANGEKRSIIFLTDGVVDISKDAGVNVKERRRILQELLPKLSAADVKIHTVALSNDVDEELLKALSRQTGAWYLKVLSADELDKAFLKLFDQVTKRDEVPLKDNTFEIDSSINEFTLLVFRTPDSAPSILISPQNVETSHPVSSNTNIRWFNEPTYDLITVKKPQSGTWKIRADIDPDNRVMIVSDISLVNSELPNLLFAGEKAIVKASVAEKGQPITARNFLMNTQFKVTQKLSDGSETSVLALDDGDGSDERFGDGVFTAALKATDSGGLLSIVTDLKSPTFERQNQQTVNVLAAPVSIPSSVAAESDKLQIPVPPVAEVDPDSLILDMDLLDPTGKSVPFTQTKGAQGSDILLVNQAVSATQLTLNLRAKGKTVSGRLFNLPSKAYTIAISLPDGVEPDPIPVKEPIPEPAADEKESSEAKDEEAPQENTEESFEWKKWLMWSGIGLAVNILLVGIVVIAIKKIKRSSRDGMESLEKALEE